MVKQIANNVIESLRHQPFALALVILNVAFLIGFAFMFREIAQSVERKDALVVELLKKCGGD
jgi:hypothetical protein